MYVCHLFFSFISSRPFYANKKYSISCYFFFCIYFITLIRNILTSRSWEYKKVKLLLGLKKYTKKNYWSSVLSILCVLYWSYHTNKSFCVFYFHCVCAKVKSFIKLLCICMRNNRGDFIWTTLQKKNTCAYF